MRITNINVTQRTNTGQYEHLEIVVSAAIDETDAMAKAVEQVTDFVDWFARKPIRDAEAHRLSRQAEQVIPDDIVEGPKAQNEVEKAKVWLAKYAARKAAIEAM